MESALCKIIRADYPDVEVLMGTSTAGIAHAAIVGHMMGLPMGYVRSSGKDHGRQESDRGPPWSRVRRSSSSSRI